MTATATTSPGLDVDRVRADFPILGQRVRGRPLVYLDNAATAQKPRAVIEAVSRYYEEDNANVHRGVHLLSERATRAFEEARVRLARHLNAPDPRGLIFTRGTTESINLVAQSWGRANLQPGDEVVISTMEHHSNIVPWQMICAERGARLRVIPIDDRGDLILEEYARLLGPRTRMVAVVHVSNSLGTINPVEQIVEMAHAHGAVVLVDGAQAMPHMQVDVQALGCDFYVLSGHKMFGPTGIGALCGRMDILESMPPWMGGGDMIRSVSFEETTYNDLPYRLEAGTPHIAGAIGLGAAVDYLNTVGLDAIARHEADLLAHGTERLSGVPGVRLLGTARHKAAVLSFIMEGVHPHDMGTILDQEGIAIRTGHHCTQPVMDRFHVPATARASLAFYNTRDEIDTLVEALHRVRRLFG